MDNILCPTRGGEASVPNQEVAIAIAKERGANLVFLHVSDARFLDMMASPILVDVEAELEGLGEFLLAMAQERAERAGVEADAVVRRGVFSEALRSVIEERDITTLVLGSSQEDQGLTSERYMSELVRWILDESPVEIFVVREGEILYHIDPRGSAPAEA